MLKILLSLCALHGCIAAGSYILSDEISVKDNSAEMSKIRVFIIQTIKQYKVELMNIRFSKCFKFVQLILQMSVVPIMIQNMTEDKAFNNYITYNILNIVCLKADQNFSGEILKPFTTSLKHRRSTRTIFMLNGSFNETSLRHMFRFCYSQSMLNVVAIFVGESPLKYYYRYKPFPEFVLEQCELRNTKRFFPHMRNIYGKAITILPSQRRPRCFVYIDRRTGRQVLAGFLGHFVQTLAWKLNATLQYPFPISNKKMLCNEDLQNISNSLLIDLPLGMFSLKTLEELLTASEPVEITPVCLMIPVADDIPLRNIYFLLANTKNIIITLIIIYAYGFVIAAHKCLKSGQRLRFTDVLLNDVSLRGVLGQPFKMALNSNRSLKVIYFMLTYVGFYFSNLYQGQLHTMLTRPPKQPQLRNFIDVRDAGLTLLLKDNELPVYRDSMEKYQLRFEITNMATYYRLLEGMNVSYAYGATHVHWMIYRQQQKYFSRDLFILSTEACFLTHILLSLQLPDNSLFRDSINKLILDVRASGMLKHWMSSHFFEMVAAGILTLKDITETKQYGGPLKVTNLYWLWCVFLILMTASVVIFCGEILKKGFVMNLVPHSYE